MTFGCISLKPFKSDEKDQWKQFPRQKAHTCHKISRNYLTGTELKYCWILCIFNMHFVFFKHILLSFWNTKFSVKPPFSSALPSQNLNFFVEHWTWVFLNFSGSKENPESAPDEVLRSVLRMQMLCLASSDSATQPLSPWTSTGDCCPFWHRWPRTSAKTLIA